MNLEWTEAWQISGYIQTKTQWETTRSNAENLSHWATDVPLFQQVNDYTYFHTCDILSSGSWSADCSFKRLGRHNAIRMNQIWILTISTGFEPGSQGRYWLSYGSNDKTDRISHPQLDGTIKFSRMVIIDKTRNEYKSLWRGVWIKQVLCRICYWSQKCDVVQIIKAKSNYNYVWSSTIMSSLSEYKRIISSHLEMYKLVEIKNIWYIRLQSIISDMKTEK